MRKRLGLSVLTLAVMIAHPSAARADDLSTLLSTATDTLLPNLTHAAHFEVANASENINLVTGINQAIAGQFATVPLGSPAGGFTSSIDPSTGVGSRNSTTFGPQFAERALTIGKRKFGIGLQFLHGSYDNLNGTDITDGSLTIQLLHEDDGAFGRLDPSRFFEGDVMTNQLKLDLTLNTALVVGTFGVTDNFDLGVVLPFVKADLTIDVDKTTQPLATRTASPTTHEFAPGPIYTGTSSAEGSASGIGDVVLRGKYNFLDPKQGSGLALALDVRIPTGDEKNFLGTGVTQAKLYVIGSSRVGWFSPHINLGYTASTGTSSVVTDFPDEINYVGGFEAECHPRLMFAADIIGRVLLDAQVTRQTTATFLAYDPDLGAVYATTLPQLEVQRQDQNLIEGALGLKINPGGEWVISVGALVPISHNGLTSNVAGFVGFDYSF